MAKPSTTLHKTSASQYSGAVKDYPRDTVSPDTPSHADNGDFTGRARFADTDRNGSSTRLLGTDPAAMCVPCLAQGSTSVTTGPWSNFEGNDAWDLNAPIGGTPDPNVGRPR